MSDRYSNFCLLFDLDGTMIDTAPGLAATMNALLAAEGRPSLSLESLRPHVSFGAKAIITHAMAATGDAAAPPELERLFHDFIRHYRSHMAEASRPYPGLAGCLDELTRSGFRLGVCTNRYESSARELLRALRLDGFFHSVTGQDSYGVAKPDPRPVLETLNAMGGDAGRSVFIGDSEIDVAAARAAGLPAIVTAFGYGGAPPEQMKADAVIGHFDELPALVKKIIR